MLNPDNAVQTNTRTRQTIPQMVIKTVSQETVLPMTDAVMGRNMMFSENPLNSYKHLEQNPMKWQRTKTLCLVVTVYDRFLTHLQ